MTIYVDADACPVQSEVISLAKAYNQNVRLVKSYAHYSLEKLPEHVEVIYVDSDAESADVKIINYVTDADIVVTQDYGLAALCLNKGCIVVHHKGFRYTDKNIDRLLAQRHAGVQARRAGFKTKGPKAFTKRDREVFYHKFSTILESTVKQ